MIKPISFCINTAKNEKEYVRLLLKSLEDHTEIEQHEVVIFVDSDNQGTYEMLLDYKEKLPNLKVCKNPTPYPVWSQHNVTLLFNAASNDILCYLQSDMVVGKDFDKHIIENLKTKETVLCCARIEPPLHPASPEKIVKDFGTTPEDFPYEEFNKFVDELQKENRPNIWGHFAPFVIYKDTWFDKLGGFDVEFRSSREDSDLIIRMGLCELDLVQSWNACVYHFTCVSSRGKNWFTSEKEAMKKAELQNHADHQEMKKFIRKWGFFGHHAQPVYDITFDVEIDRFVDFNFLKWIEPNCKRIYLSDKNVAEQLKSQLQFETSYYNNLRWGYPTEYWDKVKHLYNVTDFSNRILNKDDKETRLGDVIVSFKYSEIVDNFNEEVRSVIENIHTVVDQNQIGTFGYGPFTIEILKKNNLMDSYRKESTMQPLLDSQEFIFI